MRGISWQEERERTCLPTSQYTNEPEGEFSSVQTRKLTLRLYRWSFIRRQKRDEQLKMADQIAKMRAKLAEEEDKKKKELTELKRLEMQREQENRMQKLKEKRLAMEQYGGLDHDQVATWRIG